MRTRVLLHGGSSGGDRREGEITLNVKFQISNLETLRIMSSIDIFNSEAAGSTQRDSHCALLEDLEVFCILSSLISQ